MTTTTDEAGLLTAIEEHPDDDTPRLEFADYLDGLDTLRVECPQCDGDGEEATSDKHGYMDYAMQCRSCGGVGTIIDTSNRDRAELIRVQCELSGIGDSVDPRCGRLGHRGLQCLECWSDKRNLFTRQSQLLAANRARWERVPCDSCSGTGGHEDREGRCSFCRGSGDIGGLSERFEYLDFDVTDPDYMRTESEPVRVTWARGFPVAEVPRLADCVEPVCGLCNGTGKHGEMSPPSKGKRSCPRCQGRGTPAVQYDSAIAPTDWLRTVTLHHRGIEAVPLDRAPELQSQASNGWQRQSAFDRRWPSGVQRQGFQYAIPDAVFQMIEGKEDRESKTKYFTTRQAAILALGRALAKFGKAKPVEAT